MGVELHNLMNISKNHLTFIVETFQLSLSMKSQLNVNSSSPKRFDSERKILEDRYLNPIQAGVFWNHIG